MTLTVPLPTGAGVALEATRHLFQWIKQVLEQAREPYMWHQDLLTSLNNAEKPIDEEWQRLRYLHTATIAAKYGGEYWKTFAGDIAAWGQKGPDEHRAAAHILSYNEPPELAAEIEPGNRLANLVVEFRLAMRLQGHYEGSADTIYVELLVAVWQLSARVLWIRKMAYEAAHDPLARTACYDQMVADRDLLRHMLPSDPSPFLSTLFEIAIADANSAIEQTRALMEHPYP